MAPLLAKTPDRQFERIYRRHAGDVYRYTLAVLRNPQDAEDVTQTTFLNAYRAMQNGERPETPKNWLIAIAHNVCRQRFRQQQRRPQQTPLNEETLVDEPEETVSAEDIQRALGHLAFTQRSALVMRELEGRSYPEIALIMGVSVSAVETLLFRARRALREQLEGTLTCAEAERHISRQLDVRLSRTARGQLRAHLRECKQCEQLARSERASRGAMRALFGAIPLPSGLLPQVVYSIGTKAAAVAAAGAVVGGGGYAVGTGAVRVPLHTPMAVATAAIHHVPLVGSASAASQRPQAAHRQPRTSAKAVSRHQKHTAVRVHGTAAHASRSASPTRLVKTHPTHPTHPLHPVTPALLNRARPTPPGHGDASDPTPTDTSTPTASGPGTDGGSSGGGGSGGSGNAASPAQGNGNATEPGQQDEPPGAAAAATNNGKHKGQLKHAETTAADPTTTEAPTDTTTTSTEDTQTSTPAADDTSTTTPAQPQTGSDTEPKHGKGHK